MLFFTALFERVNIKENIQMSINSDWLNKLQHIHIMGYYSTTKRNEEVLHTLAVESSLRNIVQWKSRVYSVEQWL